MFWVISNVAKKGTSVADQLINVKSSVTYEFNISNFLRALFDCNQWKLWVKQTVSVYDQFHFTFKI
jgi:hypothetical protein